MAEKFSAEELLLRIRERFAAPAWAVLDQVRNGTGWERTTRTADAIAMSVWPSRGLELHGFEVKVSRSDWKRELKDPGKSEEIQQFCDHWWVVAPKDVVQIDELPPTWGLLEPHGKSLRVKVESPNLNSVPISRLFLASIFRSLERQNPSQKAIEAAVSAERKRSSESYEAAVEMAARHGKAEAERHKTAIAEFERASGVRLDGWRNGDIGAAVRLVLEGGLEGRLQDLTRIRETARACARIIDEALHPDNRTAAPQKEAANG